MVFESWQSNPATIAFPRMEKKGVFSDSMRRSGCGTAARVAVSLSILATLHGISAADGEVTAAAAVVEAREIAFAKTMADRDIKAFATFIADEAIFFNGNEPLRGREAVVEAWSRFFEEPEAPFSWRPDVVVVLESGDLALSSGPVLTPDGEPAGRFNSIWRRESDGEWRVVFDKGS